MSFFAVLRPTDQQTGFDVLKCHINLWSLGGFAGRRHFLLDVGLQLCATAPFRKFELALPCATEPQVEDLFERLQTEVIAGLVFGEPMTVKTGPPAILEYATRPKTRALELRRINVAACERDASSTPNFTLWKIELAADLAAGETAYFRFRFPIDGMGRTWTWKRSWPFGINGAILDFRVADLRELSPEERGRGYEQRLVPIDDLYLFVIAPLTWQPAAASPPPKYIRVLEGPSWSQYLGRTTDLGGPNKVLVHYWRHAADPMSGAPDQRVLVQQPYRAFLDLSRDVGLPPFGHYVRVAVAALVAIGLAAGLERGWQRLTGLVLALISLLVATFGAAFLITRVAQIKRGLRRADRLLRRFELWVLRVRRRD